jgi:hypothetical protein
LLFLIFHVKVVLFVAVVVVLKENLFADDVVGVCQDDRSGTDTVTILMSLLRWCC